MTATQPINDDSHEIQSMQESGYAGRAACYDCNKLTKPVKTALEWAEYHHIRYDHHTAVLNADGSTYAEYEV